MSITIVSGFGRCGSSLVMQMLEAGGMPVTGAWPAFEDARGAHVLAGGDLDVTDLDGRAIKVLDPHRGAIPAGPDYRVIWIDRDHDEQARSQVKFLQLLAGIPMERGAAKALAASYRRDKKPAIRSLLNGRPPSILALRFENLLREPKKAAIEIAEYCGISLDAIPAMVAAVHPRSTLCAPDMAMELALIAQRP